MWKKIKNFFIRLFGGINIIDKKTFDKLVETISTKGKAIYSDIDINNDGSVNLKELIDYIKNKKVGA